MKQVEDVVTEAAKKAHWWFTAMLAGAVGLLLSGMGIAAYVGGFARAETVSSHEKRLTTIETVLPMMDKKLDLLIEVDGQREWRDHRTIIPSAPARDGGAR